MRKLLAILLLATPLFGDQIASTQFKGLNNNEQSVIIDADEAQDLLNVDVSPGGRSVGKRDGFGVYKALGTGQAMHGGFHAFDSTGNDYQVWGSSRSFYGVVADGTPLQLISSATLNSTWDCTDSQGNSYCVNSSRDLYLRTDGTTKTWYTTPLGTMVESTPDRVVVAGVSGTPNTLYFSQANTFTNFTIGVNSADPFTETIASPGSKLTHIRWGCGKLLWWKDQSFGYFTFDDQYKAEAKTVSDTIGTFDNTSAIDPGGSVWFRGQDGHSYKYDCSFLEKMSIPITPNVQASGKRTANLWTQSSQSDWQAGLGIPSANFSTTISAGDVVMSSFTATDTVSADFSQGSTSNSTINSTGVKISTNNTGSINDPSFEGTITDYFSVGNPSSTEYDASESANSCTLSPQSGSKFMRMLSGSAVSVCNVTYGVKILDAFTGEILDTKSTSGSDNSCAWASETFTSAANSGKRVKFVFYERMDNCAGTTFILTSTTTASHIFGGSISYYKSCNASTVGNHGLWCSFDNVSGGSSTITTGAFTSRTFDATLTANIATIQANWTVNTSTPYIEIQSSTNGTDWTKVSGSSGTNQSTGRYIRYLSSFTVGSSDNALTTLDDVTVIAKSTGGVFLSQVKNAPNITGWSTFTGNVQSDGGSHTFFSRSSTTFFTTNSSTPAWVSQPNGALVAGSTGTYFQIRDDFATTSATATLALNDFTVNWFEGSATDQAYMLYFDNAIWQSVAFGSGQSTNNYIFKYDLINQGWTLYNFGAGGLLVQGNRLYFGDTSAGNVFNFGTSTSDNGTAINAFWRSKTFTGADPFMQSSLTNIDLFAKKDQGTTLTGTYTIDTSSATAYSISLSTSNAITQNRKGLPAGKTGYTFDYKFGDTSTSSAWEVLGYRITFNQLPWRPTN